MENTNEIIGEISVDLLSFDDDLPKSIDVISDEEGRIINISYH